MATALPSEKPQLASVKVIFAKIESGDVTINKVSNWHKLPSTIERLNVSLCNCVIVSFVLAYPELVDQLKL